jgi:hypothetical protein
MEKPTRGISKDVRKVRTALGRGPRTSSPEEGDQDSQSRRPPSSQYSDEFPYTETILKKALVAVSVCGQQVPAMNRAANVRQLCPGWSSSIAARAPALALA